MGGGRGESVPVQKQLDALPPETEWGDRRNMAYSSTLITYGTGAGVVVAIGDQTEIGHIHELTAPAVELETPLTRKSPSSATFCCMRFWRWRG